MAGGQQEGRGATVALHADDVVARLGVRQFVHTVWTYGAAGVVVGVDQGSQQAGGAEDGIQVQPQLTGDGVIRPVARGGDDVVGSDRPIAAPGAQLDRAVGEDVHTAHPEARRQLDQSFVHEQAQARAEGAAGGQGVVVPAAVGAVRRIRADGPGDAGARRLLHQVGERQESGGGRVPGSDHDHVAACEAVAVGAEHVGQRVVDPVGRLPLAVGGKPVGAEHVRGGPGAGDVDHRPGADLAVVLQAHDERRVPTARRTQPVDVHSADRRHSRARWAAAARPTGPAPTTATGRAGFIRRSPFQGERFGVAVPGPGRRRRTSPGRRPAG